MNTGAATCTSLGQDEDFGFIPTLLYLFLLLVIYTWREVYLPITRSIALDRANFLVTRLLSVRPMNFNALAQSLPIGRKKLYRVIKELVRQDAVVADPEINKTVDMVVRRGRPPVWLSLTKSGTDLFLRHLSAILIDLDVLFGNDFLIGPCLSSQAYGMRFALPLIEVIVGQKDLMKNTQITRQFEGIVDKFFLWLGDREPFERSRTIAIGKVQVPVLSLEDLILFTMKFERVSSLVKVIPVILASAGSEFDYVYLHRRAAEYGVLQEVGFLLDVASYLDADLERTTGVTLFSRSRSEFGDRNFQLSKEKVEAHPRILSSPRQPVRGKPADGNPTIVPREEGGIAPFQWFWKLKRTPSLDDFIETFVTYSSGAKTEKLLGRLYDEGYGLLTKEINADLLKSYVEA
jgi:hypothetical protein